MFSRCIALVLGVLCQVTFLLAVLVMAIGLHGEMRVILSNEFIPRNQTFLVSLGWDLFLLLLFPLAHSIFLTPWGRRVLARAFPGELGKSLVTTTFVVVTSLQLIALFVLWSPLSRELWRPEGLLKNVWEGVYWSSWLLLGVAMYQAGLGIQMGLLGWTSVVQGKKPTYPSMPKGFLYSVCRHPVYFAMALVSITGPVWTIDHIVIGGVFLAYCIVGPFFKERRFSRMFGEAFLQYRLTAPFFPTPRSLCRALASRR